MTRFSIVTTLTFVRAPLAQLVIGRKAGDSVSVPDPDFDGEYLAAEIVSVGPLPPEVLAWAR